MIIMRQIIKINGIVRAISRIIKDIIVNRCALNIIVHIQSIISAPVKIIIPDSPIQAPAGPRIAGSLNSMIIKIKNIILKKKIIRTADKINMLIKKAAIGNSHIICLKINGL